MITPRRVGRWALYGLAGVVGLVVLARVGLGIYLSTPAGKSMVARQIASRLGMPVEVQSVRLGLRTSSIALRVFDPAAPDPAGAEVLAVESASADVSLLGLLLGRVAPDEVELRGLNLTLHVSADGDVRTTLPKSAGGGAGVPTPAIKLTGGRITVRQDGRPEFALRNLALAVTPRPNGGVTVSGTIDDPDWSTWTVSGDVSGTGPGWWVELATGDGPLTMDRLTSVPFVPPAVWESVRANGRGAAAVRLWADPAGGVEYSVDIRPAAASLTLPDASVTFTKLTGGIVVSGARVELRDCKAELAGGTFAATGYIDFGPEPTVASLKVDASRLDTRLLPAEWGLPKKIDGKLTGHADLTLKIHADGTLEPEGGGEGVITDVRVLDFPADDVPIHLRKRGNRYRFEQPKADGDSRRVEPRGPARELRELPELLSLAVFQPGPEGGTRQGAARQDTRVPLAKIWAESRPPGQPKQDPKKPPAKADDDPITLDATIRLRDVDVGELLARLDVKLGYAISGKITVEASVAVPVSQALSGSAYQFSGKASSAALTFEGLTVRNLSAKMVYQNGKLTLTDLGGTIDQPGKSTARPGTFRGTASAAVSPPGDAAASLAVTDIPLGEVLKAVPGLTLDVRGTVSGKVDLKAPYEKLWDTTVWSGSAELTSAEVVAEGRTVQDVRLAASVAKGTLTLTEAKAAVEGIPLTAEATVGLAGKYPFAATVRTTGTNVTDLRKLVPEIPVDAPVEGALETETKVTGTASPFTLAASGTVSASKLTLARTPANRVAARWAADTEKFSVTEVKADVFGGSLTGSLEYPFAADRRGKFEVGFKDLDAAAASELVPDFPVRVGGKVSGKVAGAIEPAKPGQSRVGNIELDVSAPRLTVQGVPAERLVGRASLRGGVLEYALEGKTLGGSFDLKGRYPGAEKKPAGKDDPPPGRGMLRVTGVDLARLAPELRFEALAPLRGRVDVAFDFDDDLSDGSGRVVIRGLRWGQEAVSEELVGVLRLRGGLLELADVGGTIAGGTLRARGRVLLTDTSRNFFSVTLSGADAGRLLAPVPALADAVTGPLTLVVRGRLGAETRVSGTASLARGTVSGVAVSDLRIPFELATARGGYGRLTVRDAAVQAGSGRATASVTADWGVETRVDGLVRFTDVPLAAVAPGLGESGFFGNGRITGRFDLAGRNVRSVDELTGTLVATLNQTSVRELPLLRQATPFLNPSGLVKPFNAGDVRATLSRGIFRVERLALANPSAQLFAAGTVSTVGRVDLDVVAHTGTVGPDASGLRLFVRRLPLLGPIPIGLIRDVSDFLSNRTVRLSITGTTDNPVVRVNVGALLTEEAVRFFLTRYVVPADAAAALGLGTAFGSTEPKR